MNLFPTLLHRFDSCERKLFIISDEDRAERKAKKKPNARHKSADVAIFIRCQLEMNYYLLSALALYIAFLNVFMHMFL